MQISKNISLFNLVFTKDPEFPIADFPKFNSTNFPNNSDANNDTLRQYPL